MTEVPAAAASLAYDVHSFAPFVSCAGPSPDYRRICEITNNETPFGPLLRAACAQDVDSNRSIVELPEHPRLRNHVGTVHVVALFLAADLAGAVAFVGATAPHIERIRWAVVRGLHCAFFKPARGPIRAVGTVDERDVRDALDPRGRPKAEVAGRSLLYDRKGELLAKITFEWTCHVTAIADPIP